MFKNLINYNFLTCDADADCIWLAKTFSRFVVVAAVVVVMGRYPLAVKRNCSSSHVFAMAVLAHNLLIAFLAAPSCLNRVLAQAITKLAMNLN
jgi:hypothetical protein